MSSQELKGLSELVNPMNAKSNLSYADIELSMVNSGTIEKPTNQDSKFKTELQSLARQLNIDIGSPDRRSADHRGGTPNRSMPGRGNTPRRTPMPSDYLPPTPGRNSPRRGGESRDDYGSPRGSPRRGESRDDYGSPRDSPRRDGERDHGTSNLRNQYDDDDGGEEETEEGYDDDGGEDYDSPAPSSSDRSYGGDPFSNFDYSQRGRGGSYDSNEFDRRTDEDLRNREVRAVMHTMNPRGSNIVSLDEEDREDRKMLMLDEIDSLWRTLSEEDDKMLVSITRPNENSSFDEVHNVLRRLRLKNDRLRYTSLAGELILFGASALEEIFDGERKIFGRYRVDLRGWSKEVQVKLRRMRHDTSTLVSSIMQDYNVGSGTRIMFELGPNAYLYAKKKKQDYGKNDIFTDRDISDSFEKIRDL
jgi:hypothetical protein